MIASLTPLPVIGVPVESRALKGLDSLLSIVQMPPGIPVATVAIGGARNAGLLAARILGASDAALSRRVAAAQAAAAAASRASNRGLREKASPPPRT
jgi:5-(carboxyamino)imidazole ribonucleotide mutase